MKLETLKEQQEFIAEITDETPLTVEILKEYGFTLETADYTEYNEEIYHFNGVDIHFDTWSKDFMFATYVRSNGYSKSGFSLNTVGRLKACYFGITSTILMKVSLPNKL